MATLHLTPTTTVAQLRKQFNDAFGAQVKVYSGRSIADFATSLSDLGLNQTIDFECRANLTVSSFIERMQEECGLKVKVYTCDEWVAVLDGLTLESAGKVKKNAVKADMEDMIAYRREDQDKTDEEIDDEDEFEDDEEFDDEDGDFCDNVEYKGIEYSCADGEAEASMFVDEDLELAAKITIPEIVKDSETNNKCKVTGYTISDGAYTEIQFPSTLRYIQGETFSEIDEDKLSILKHNLEENKEFIVKDRWIYQYEKYGEEEPVYVLKNIQLNRPKGLVIIPEGVVGIARSLFANCDKLNEIILPSTLHHIDFEPFEGCSALKRIVVRAPKNQILCYDDLGDKMEGIEKIIPNGVELVYEKMEKTPANNTQEDSQEYNRAYWIERSSEQNLGLVDYLLDIINSVCQDRYELKYNKAYIGLTHNSKPRVFVAFRPQKGDLKISVYVKQTPEFDKILAEKLDSPDCYDEDKYKCHIQVEDIEKKGGFFAKLFGKTASNLDALIPVLIQAEKEAK